MKIKCIAAFGVFLFLSASIPAARAETRQLTWAAVTTYTDGSPIETWKKVNYAVYWSNDPWLSANTLRNLVSSTTATSATFDPAVQGISDYQTVYFTVKSVLDTGEESELSDAMPWNPPSTSVSSVVPMPPESLGITTSSGMWTLSWDPVSKDTSGATIEAGTVRYSLYWTTDAALSPELLTSLGSSITQTFFTFDPLALGTNGNQRVYFVARTVLTTGEESSLSGSLSMHMSTSGPGAPKNARMVRKNRK